MFAIAYKVVIAKSNEIWCSSMHMWTSSYFKQRRYIDGIMLVFWSDPTQVYCTRHFTNKVRKVFESLNSTIYATNVQDFDIFIGTLEMQATNSCVVHEHTCKFWRKLFEHLTFNIATSLNAWLQDDRLMAIRGMSLYERRIDLERRILFVKCT